MLAHSFSIICGAARVLGFGVHISDMVTLIFSLESTHVQNLKL